MNRRDWFILIGTDWRWSRVRVLLLHVDMRIIILSRSYLRHSGNTLIVTNLQLEANIGKK